MKDLKLTDHLHLQSLSFTTMLRDETIDTSCRDLVERAVDLLKRYKKDTATAGLADIIDIIKEDYKSDCTRLSNADIVKMLEPFAGVTKSGEPSRLMQSKDSCDYCDGVNCELCIDKHLFNGREAIVL